jgi:hypothetical protein
MKALAADQAVDNLTKAGIEPVAEYVAAAGRDYGWVKAWLTDGRYVVQYGDNANTYVDVSNDVDDLAEWLELWTLSGLDALVHTANVRGADEVPEAEESDEGPFYVLETRYWYGATETSSLVMDNTGREPLEFESIDEARAWIDDVEDRPYWLLHNESGRPSYKVVPREPRRSYRREC